MDAFWESEGFIQALTGRDAARYSLEKRTDWGVADGGGCGNVNGMSRPQMRLASSEGDALSIREALEGWKSYMAAKGKKPQSYRAYQARVHDLCRFHDWRTVADLTFQGAMKYLEAKREKGWSGTTYDWTVVCFASFGRYMDAMGVLKPSPFAGLEATGEKGERGSRPFTPLEVEALIREFASRMLRSNRSRGNPALWTAFLALTGLRCNEAKCLRWNNLSLEGDDPFLETDPRWSKSKRRDRVPIQRALAVLLERHRLELPNWHPAGPVFPIRPNRASFQSVREAAGIALETIDGRATPHGLRKSFATWLDAAGNSPGVVSSLTRHAEGMAQERYIRPDWAKLRAAVEGLPTVFPTFLVYRLDKPGSLARYSSRHDRVAGDSMQKQPANTTLEEGREGGNPCAVVTNRAATHSRPSSSAVVGRTATSSLEAETNQAAFAASIGARSADCRSQSETTSITNVGTGGVDRHARGGDGLVAPAVVGWPTNPARPDGSDGAYDPAAIRAAGSATSARGEHGPGLNPGRSPHAPDDELDRHPPSKRAAVGSTPTGGIQPQPPGRAGMETKHGEDEGSRTAGMLGGGPVLGVHHGDQHRGAGADRVADRDSAPLAGRSASGRVTEFPSSGPPASPHRAGGLSPGSGASRPTPGASYSDGALYPAPSLCTPPSPPAPAGGLGSDTPHIEATGRAAGALADSWPTQHRPGDVAGGAGAERRASDIVTECSRGTPCLNPDVDPEAVPPRASPAPYAKSGDVTAGETAPLSTSAIDAMTVQERLAWARYFARAQEDIRRLLLALLIALGLGGAVAVASGAGQGERTVQVATP